MKDIKKENATYSGRSTESDMRFRKIDSAIS